jgi:diaminohydroxyphosphoribosylaminopyrimidine deaminase / 5-amino-6-(5-phosphoribosylamino)uracil reductase
MLNNLFTKLRLFLSKEKFFSKKPEVSYNLKMGASTTFPNDEQYIRRCLQLALNGKATCSPNPMVGAVVVCDGRIIGEGWHRKAGEPHAEPNAIRSVRDQTLLRKSTLYVSLEPCSHYGKTPPCVELIIRKGIPRVVIGSLDPFPLVAGRGVRKLQDAGIEVVVGVQKEACRALNKSFFAFQERKRPYVILKWAQTADDFIDIHRTLGDGQPPLKISSSFTQMVTHKLRTECDVILVGTRTALLDNPSLSVRFWPGKNPLRAVIDRQKTLPGSLHLLDGSLPTLVFTGEPSTVQGKVSWVKLDFAGDFLEEMMQFFYVRNIQTLLVEGGALLHESMLKAGLWDDIYVETSPQRIEDGVPAPNIKLLSNYSVQEQSFNVDSNGRKLKIYHRL